MSEPSPLFDWYLMVLLGAVLVLFLAVLDDHYFG